MNRLSPDILDIIFSMLSINELCSCRRVSKLWNQQISHGLSIKHSIDFGWYSWKINFEAFRSCLLASNGHLETLVLTNIAVSSYSDCAAAVFGFDLNEDPEGAFEYVPKSQRIPRELVSSMRRLEFDYPASIWTHLSNKSYLCSSPSPAPFSNLKHLRVRIEDTNGVMSVVTNNRFPNLEVLEMLGVYEVLATVIAERHLKNIAVGSPQPQVKVLRFGGPMPYTNHFPYSQKCRSVCVTTQDLHLLLSAFPGLHELSLIRLTNIIYGRQLPSEASCLDLQFETPELRKLDLSWCELARIHVKVPDMVQVLKLNFTHLGSFSPFITPSAEQMSQFQRYQIVNEFRHLWHLSIAGNDNQISAASIVNGIAQYCNASTLKELVLHGHNRRGLAGINYGADFVAQSYESSNFSFLGTLSEVVPNLEALAIGFNNTLTDAELFDVKKFTRLTYIDVSFTAVSTDGVAYLMRRRGRRGSSQSRMTIVVHGCDNVHPLYLPIPDESLRVYDDAYFDSELTGRYGVSERQVWSLEPVSAPIAGHDVDFIWDPD